jgi:hypothetical protein
MIEVASLDEELALLNLRRRKGILWQVNPITNSSLGNRRIPLDGFEIHPLGVLFEFSLLRDHDDFLPTGSDNG